MPVLLHTTDKLHSENLLIKTLQLPKSFKCHTIICSILSTILLFYCKSQEEFKCQKAKIGGINKSWQPVQQAIELWSSAENMEELQGYYV